MFDHASVNRAYRLVWSDRLGAYVAAAETTRGRGKRAVASAAALLIAALGASGGLRAQALAPPAVTQLPTGGRVVAGQANITQSTTLNAARMDVTQSGNRAAVDWQSFNVGAQAQVNFHQPSAQSVILNRVLDTQPSQIYGRISANGQVFLTNPNGVYFGPTASVDVAGLVASTHGISNADFMAGKSTLTRNGAGGAVVNQGRLTSGLNGYIALLAPEVRNEGVVIAQAGTALLAAGESITLNFNGDNRLVGVTATPAQIKALVDNQHAVLAPGGLIVLSAQAADWLQGGVVNNRGTLEAQGITHGAGRIVLEASDRIENTGVVRADAGRIEARAATVHNAGTLAAAGGAIEVLAIQALVQAATGRMDVSGAQAGGIALKADYNVDLNGGVRAVSATGRGGTVTIEGDYIRLAAESSIDARGASGGGTVLAGGDWQGSGTMHQARQVAMQAGAVINVSATQEGDGGKAVLWSDIHQRDGGTRFDGRIYALPAGNGRGGRVETSGHQLAARGTAFAGKGGLWLLDPYDVVISSAANSNVDGSFNATGTPAVVDTNAIAAALTAGSDVTVFTGNTGNEAGNITLDTNIVTGAMANDATLTLKAHNSIFVNFRNTIDATQNANANKLNVVLWANAAGSGQGRIEMGASTGIYTNGGNIVLGGGSDIATGYAIGTGTHNASRGIWLRDGALLNAGGGNITLRGQGKDGMAVAIGDPGDFGAGGATLYTSGTGSITINGVATTSSGGHAPTGIYLHQDVRIQTADGAITLSGVGGTSPNSVLDNSGVALVYGGSLLSESGTITVEGTRGAATGGSGSGIRFYQGTKYFGHDEGANLGRSSSNIIFRADSLGWDGGTTTLNTTGVLTFEPRGASFASPFTWAGSLATGNFTGSASLGGFIINDLQNLAGVTLGKAGNTAGITIASPLTMGGALNLFGGDIQVNSPINVNNNAMTVTHSGMFSTANNTDIRADAGFTQNGNGSSSLSGEIRTDNAPIQFAGGIVVRDQLRLRSDGGNITLSGAVSGVPGVLTDLRVESGSGSIALNGAISNLDRLTLTSTGMTTQSARVSVSNVLLNGSGDYFLDHSQNQINTLAANVGAGSVILKNNAPLTIGTVNGVSGVRSTSGTVQIETTAGHALNVNQAVSAPAPALLAGGDFTLAASVSASMGDLLLTAGGAFINTAGASALATPGRWLVYSNSPYANQFGGLASGNTGLFGKTFATYNTADLATDGYTGNRFLFAATESLTVTTTGMSNTYGNAPLSLASNYTLSPLNTFGGAIAAPTVTGMPLMSSSGSSATAHAGSYAITADVSGMAVNAPGYQFVANNAGTLTITPRPLTLTGSRVYDATTAMPANVITPGNIVNGDTVSVTGSGVLSGKNVGTQSLAGAGTLISSNSNYTLSGATGTFQISPTMLAVSGVTAQNKVYDAGVQATLAGAPTVNALGTDNLSIGGSAVAQFADKNTGNSKPVTVSGFTLLGTDAGNYVLQQPAGLTANILQATLAVSGLTAQHKVYDATTQAAVLGTAVVSPLGSDVVGLTGTASAQFSDKNAGNAKPVNVSGYALTGADAGNYVLQQPTGLSANITPATLTVSGVTAQHKVYDASVLAALAGAPVVSPLGTDGVSVTGSAVAQFGDKNVGSAKAVSVSGYTLSGADAGNYVLQQPTGLSANITPATLTVSGVTAQHKVYDAGTQAVLNGTAVVSALGSDVVNVGGTASAKFGDKNVGTAKPVSVNGYALGGADAGNYVLLQPAGLSANITPATLIVGGVTAQNKVYDATMQATLAGTPTVNALRNDVVTVGGQASALFGDKNVGNAKPVIASGYILQGADAGNYVLQAPVGLSANITPATVAVGGVTAQNKVYDGTTTATLAGTPSVSVLGADVVTIGGIAAANFGDASIGTGKPVTVGGYVLQGIDANNYVLQQPAGLRANIAEAPQVTASAPASPSPTAPVLDTEARAMDWFVPTKGGTLDLSAAFGGNSAPVLTAQAQASRPNEFTFDLPQAFRAMLDNADSQRMAVSGADSGPLPKWLRFDRWGKRLVATAVPENALPLTVLITLGTQKTVVKLDLPAALRTASTETNGN